MLHFFNIFKLAQTDQLRHFAYNTPEANQAVYGSPEPPHYNVNGTTTATYLYYSPSDDLGDVEDICMLTTKNSCKICL